MAMNKRTPSTSISPSSDLSLRLRLSVVAAASFVTLAAFGNNAYAAGFGRLHVHSALGQPLRAEVELINSQAGVKAGLAPASMYAQRGLDYSSVLTGVHASVQRTASGRTVLRISSDRALNDPFLDIVLVASDDNGTVVRDFSLLLDPPEGGREPAAVVAPQIMQRPASARGSSHSAASGARRKGGGARHATRSGSVRVKHGDTAGQIAAARRPVRVSLDQMLLAMLRLNPHAFIGGNINRLKSGVVLQMPTAAQARATSAGEARQAIRAQSSDFRGYRHKLARATTVEANMDAHQTAGAVQANVQDARQSAATAPDALTLSKGAVSAGAKTEQRIAQAVESKANVNRTAELNKNLDDLKKLSTEAVASSAAAARHDSAASPSVPAINVQTPAALAAASTASPAEAEPPMNEITVAPVAEPAPTDAVQPAASAQQEPSSAEAAGAQSDVPPPETPAQEKPAEKKAPPPPVVEEEEPGLIDTLLGNLPLLGGGLLLLLGGGFLAWRARKRKQDEEDMGLSSAFTESSLASDSFFHATGGKNVDTSQATNVTDLNQSSMLYSPSQLDADADVDPVSEADVYLAYGREAQAEEILKDALLKNPARAAVHAKLLEIYGRRRDVQAYAEAAQELKRLTNASGPDWELACKNGLLLDPGNPLYADASAAAPTPPAPAPVQQQAPQQVSQPSVTTAAPPSLPPQVEIAPPAAQNMSAQQQMAAPQVAVATAPAAIAPVSVPAVSTGMPDLSPATVLPSGAPAPQKAQEQEQPLDLAFDLNMQVEQTAPVMAAEPSAEDKALEFDMGALSLELNAPVPEPADLLSPVSAPMASAASDSMATKLELAQEFMAIGDREGARTMAEEVARNAQGDIKARAEEFLRSLG